MSRESRADYRRDAAAQVDEHNASLRDEHATDRAGAEVYGWDEPPTRREVEADEREWRGQW